nr:integrase, catalytic region, zinc finger, CCHC-type, peptidase aspartic, catalytic [Tanacetum cinerariifolium]
MKRLFKVTQLDLIPTFIGPWGRFRDPRQPSVKKKGVDGKLAGFLTASKDLDNLIESQRSDKNKDGLRYSVVPPPPAQIYSSPKKDMSWTGLLEFADDKVTDYSRPSPTIESSSGDDQNKNPSVTKTEASPSTISPKPFIKFMKAAERSTRNKVETVKKPSVKDKIGRLGEDKKKQRYKKLEDSEAEHQKKFPLLEEVPTARVILTLKSRQAYNVMTNNINHFKQIVDVAWIKHSKNQFRAPTAQDMEILIQTCLIPLAVKTHNDSFKFVHELKQEMHADLKYVESFEKEIDELESDKAEFSNMYDEILQDCVSKDVMCSYLTSLSNLDALDELQCLYLHKVKECKTVCNEKASNVFRKEREQYFKIQDLKAQLQDKNIANRVNHKPNVSIPQLKSNQSRDKVLPKNSQVKVKKTQLEVHPRIPSVSNKMKPVTTCKDSLNSRTLNANVVCATYNKCLIDSNHFACVTKILNDVHARTKKPTVVPISTRKLKSQANKLIATPNKKKVASKSTKQEPHSYFRVLYENTSNLKLLCNFVEKFLGTIRFGNDQFAPILGYGDLVQGNVTINRVYYVEGLNHNLFSVGQFCDADLEVDFRKSICFVRDL